MGKSNSEQQENRNKKLNNEQLDNTLTTFPTLPIFKGEQCPLIMKKIVISPKICSPASGNLL